MATRGCGPNSGSSLPTPRPGRRSRTTGCRATRSARPPKRPALGRATRQTAPAGRASAGIRRLGNECIGARRRSKKLWSSRCSTNTEGRVSRALLGETLAARPRRAGNVPGMAVALCVILWAVPGREEELVAYEDWVLRLLADHGGLLLTRARALEDGPTEVQVLEFASEQALSEFMSDPQRGARSPLRARRLQRTEVIPVELVEHARLEAPPQCTAVIATVG